MTRSLESGSAPSPELRYSPQHRAGLILTGAGTAGAYHAGVLRALGEAGVKIDVVGGHGIGAVGALFAAVDAGQRLWEKGGFWRSAAVREFYPWRWTLRVAAWALGLSLALVAIPIGIVALGLVVYPIDFMLDMMGLGGPDDLVERYLRFAQWTFSPSALPTWLPRLVLLLLGYLGLLALVAGWVAGRGRRQRGPFWWRAIGPPLSSGEAITHCWRVLWDLLRGAAPLKQPPTRELARRYVDLVMENLSQPGFRELVLGVHDVDANRDMIFVLAAEPRRRELIRRPTTEATEERRAEMFDLSGVDREYLADVVAAALALPLLNEPRMVRFAPEGYWRGEAHRLSDRPGLLVRLIEELTALGAAQILVVSAAPEPRQPHALSRPRLDGRGRFGEYLQSAEAAAVRDVTRSVSGESIQIYTIRPEHNAVGPFDFGGGFDDRSDRRQPLEELMAQGYQDAYRQFIEPVVGASGERLNVRSQKAEVRS